MRLLHLALAAILLSACTATSLAVDRPVLTPGGTVDVRIFGKPTSRPYRRMGVTLASAGDTDTARRIAAEAAGKVRIEYG